MTAIRLIVGLGNPGPEHVDDRHNAGFHFVDALLAQHSRTPQWRREAKFFGETARMSVGGNEVWLLKPMTYMNRSGQAAAAFARFYRIAPPEILVAYDELDLPPGVIRVKKGGGSGGHNGIKDLVAHLGADFWRLRIGIGHPRDLAPGRDVADYVLSRPTRSEQQAIESRLPEALAAVEPMVAGQPERATQRLHSAEK